MLRSVEAMLARIATFAIDGVDPRHVSVEVDIRSRAARVHDRRAGRRGGARVARPGPLGDPQLPVRVPHEPDHRQPRAGVPAQGRPRLRRRARARRCSPRAARSRPRRSTSYAVFGELSLGGELRDSPGALAVAEGARRAGLTRLIVPRERAREAALVDGLEVAGVTSLRAAADVVVGARPPALPDAPAPPGDRARPSPTSPTSAGTPPRCWRSQIAAAGGHNLLLEGPPGTGKTMLARRLPSILPAHDPRGGDRGDPDPQRRRPARRRADLAAAVPRPAPHDLAGGTRRRRLAAAAGRGDARAPTACCSSTSCRSSSARALDALRQPLEDGCVTIVRAQRALVFPTAFMLVAATNPCPCGFAGVGDRCTCGETEICVGTGAGSAGRCSTAWTCWSTSSVPPRTSCAPTPATSSARARERVADARERQRARLRDTGASATARWTPGWSAATCGSRRPPSGRWLAPTRSGR